MSSDFTVILQDIGFAAFSAIFWAQFVLLVVVRASVRVILQLSLECTCLQTKSCGAPPFPTPCCCSPFSSVHGSATASRLALSRLSGPFAS